MTSIEDTSKSTEEIEEIGFSKSEVSVGYAEEISVSKSEVSISYEEEIVEKSAELKKSE